MTRSANEVMALAAKAARGAGAPPAQAAEFGRAAVCHLCAGRDAAGLRDALAALPEGPILSLPLNFARVIEAAKTDVAEGIIPCATHTPLGQSYAEAVPYVQVNTPVSEGLHLRIETSNPAPRRAMARVFLNEDLAQYMTTLAARTFVPESDASRLAGAGAGLTDND